MKDKTLTTLMLGALLVFSGGCSNSNATPLEKSSNEHSVDIPEGMMGKLIATDFSNKSDTHPGKIYLLIDTDGNEEAAEWVGSIFPLIMLSG